ncbi:MAG: hypothetical protein JSV21_07510 [Nitrospirota bacterium]|nr:MAG: hypothetical protein JSV21_07510 [Nitrospirota bacterium]
MTTGPMISHSSLRAVTRITFGIMVIASLMILTIAGCSKGPSQTPQQFVKIYLTKKVAMNDLSLADFFVTEERKGVTERLKNAIAEQKENGIAAHAGATYDLSKVQIEVVGNKDYYVADEPKKFVKVEANGSYTVSDGDRSEVNEIHETIILEALGDHWAITEKINPWK